MTKTVNKKTSLSEEEKLRIKEIKHDLESKAIPRNEWAVNIQNELQRERVLNKKQKKTSRRLFRTISNQFNHIGTIIKKNIMKRMLKKQGNYSDQEIDNILKMMEGGSVDGVNLGLPNLIDLPNGVDVQKHSTFLTKDQELKRKKVEVFFEDDDEE